MKYLEIGYFLTNVSMVTLFIEMQVLCFVILVLKEGKLGCCIRERTVFTMDASPSVKGCAL